jgi:hypothetical protein
MHPAKVGCQVAGKPGLLISQAMAAAEAVTGFQSVVSLLAWCLIMAEMMLNSCISATVAAWSPVLPVDRRESWKRFTAVSK